MKELIRKNAKRIEAFVGVSLMVAVVGLVGGTQNNEVDFEVGTVVAIMCLIGSLIFQHLSQK